MDWWTVFYWCNWVSWSSLVGIFIAKISKGRTVMECITASLTGPVLFSFIWFSVFGGAGLRMERQAVLDGCLGNCKTVMGGVPFDRSFCKPLNQVSWLHQSVRATGFRRPKISGACAVFAESCSRAGAHS